MKINALLINGSKTTQGKLENALRQMKTKYQTHQIHNIPKYTIYQNLRDAAKAMLKFIAINAYIKEDPKLTT